MSATDDDALMKIMMMRRSWTTNTNFSSTSSE